MVEHDWPRIIDACRQLYIALIANQGADLLSNGFDSVAGSFYGAEIKRSIGEPLSVATDCFRYDPRNGEDRRIGADYLNGQAALRYSSRDVHTGFRARVNDVPAMLRMVYLHEPTKRKAALRVWRFCADELMPAFFGAEPTCVSVANRDGSPANGTSFRWVYPEQRNLEQLRSDFAKVLNLPEAKLTEFSAAVDELAAATGNPIRIAELKTPPVQDKWSGASDCNGSADDQHPRPNVDDTARKIEATYLPSELMRELEVSDTTVRTYATKAGVDRPTTGVRDFRYPLASVLKILDAMIAAASSPIKLRAEAFRQKVGRNETESQK